MSVVVVILNWHSAGSTLECLEAVQSSVDIEPEVLIVDNGSSDGSAEELERAITELGDRRVHFLGRSENSGYAGGMNAGLEWASRREGNEYVLLLTPDAIVRPETISALVEALEGEPQAAVAGPVVVYREGPEPLIGAGGAIEPDRLQSYLHREVRGSEPYPVDWIDGCCMLLRRSAVEEIGGLDERYFLYYEETDLCSRLSRAGWQIILVPEVEVLHEKESAPPSYYYYYMSRNRYHFWVENHRASVFRVGLGLAADSLRLLGAWGLSLLLPGRLERRRDDGLRLVRQLRGGLRGTRDYLRGELGPLSAP